MKTQQIFKRSFLLIILSVFLFSLNSCEKDEDPEPTDKNQDEEVLFRVELVSLTGTAIPESDNLLEVYGTITAKLNVGNLYDETTLWTRNAAAYISVGEEEVEVVGVEIFTIRESEISQSSIELNADLLDYDGENNADEPLGDVTNTVDLQDISEQMMYEMTFKESEGHAVLLKYSITRL